MKELHLFTNLVEINIFQGEWVIKHINMYNSCKNYNHKMFDLFSYLPKKKNLHFRFKKDEDDFFRRYYLKNIYLMYQGNGSYFLYYTTTDFLMEFINKIPNDQLDIQLPRIVHTFAYKTEIINKKIIDLFLDKFYFKNENINDFCIHYLVNIMYKIHKFIAKEKMNELILLIENKKINISNYQKNSLRYNFIR